MAFNTEPTGYEKTAISDLQGAWGNLRSAVIESFGFPDSDKLLFHINEAMSWESVRSLESMEATLLLVQNIARQTSSPDEVIEWLDDVRQCFTVALNAIANGKAR